MPSRHGWFGCKSECCTGVCDISLGKGNRDGNGRRLCVKGLGVCTDERNCRGGRACVAGVSGGQVVPPGPSVPLGDPCVAGVDMRAGNASCQQLTGGIQQMKPDPASYCSLENRSSCAPGDELVSPPKECVGGWCSPNGNVCGEIVIVTACTARTDSCASTNRYIIVLNMNICATSAGGRLIGIAPASGGSGCATDAE